MHPNETLLTTFYSAFAARDHGSMGTCYSDAATFGDPVFPELDAAGARAMWRMFCTSGNDVAVTFSEVHADDESGSAEWDAIYRFPKTGREVHNRIEASFTFEDGLIVRHRDRFDFYRWSRMALGPLGAALGWTPFLKNQVRQQAAAQLQRFRSGESAGAPPG